jgi:hypothetical protein
MKLVPVKNVSGKRLAITAVRGLVFSPGEVKKVNPATVSHPAVSRYIGRGLELVEAESTEEPKAPKPSKVVEPETTTAPEVTEPTTEPDADASDDEPEETGVDLRELYVSAPGITEKNVEDILALFPTLEELRDADKDDLIAAGVSKAYVKKLSAWASDQ